MASIYNEKKMVTNPFKFIIIIPIGVIILLLLADFFMGLYSTTKIEKDVKEVFTQTMDKEGLETIADMEEYMRDKFTEKGYKTEEIDFSLTEKDEYKLLVVYGKYYSLKNQITGTGSKLTVVRYKGYYNKYKETVIEKYDEDEDDDLIDKVDTKEETTTTKVEDEWDEPTEIEE